MSIDDLLQIRQAKLSQIDRLAGLVQQRRLQVGNWRRPLHLRASAPLVAGMVAWYNNTYQSQ